VATEAELDFLKSQEYYSLVVLEDGTICGLSRLMFTTALYIGLNGDGWERRYCYPEEQQALKALGYLKTGDDEPARGYVARRSG
jgi:hypothetical protein